MLGQYDFWTVVCSFLIACLAGFVAFELVDHTQSSDHPRLWVTLGGITLGLGIWSMHFVGMLAWHPPYPLFYSVTTTVLSMLVAIVASVLAFYLVAADLKVHVQLFGALLVGCGICAMHYIGMAALRFSGHVIWHSQWVLLSWVIAVLASWAAMEMLGRSRRRTASIVTRLCASLIIGCAICGMHYTGMQAFMPGPGARSLNLRGFASGTVLARIGVGNALLLTIVLLLVSYRDKAMWAGMVMQARVEAEETTRKLERMATAGKIAASVAHEINNPLESVTNLLYLAQNGEIGVQEREYLLTAQEELKRISKITTHTLRFYRQQTNPTATSIPELFESALTLFHASLLAGNVHVEKQWTNQLPRVICREGEIRQVIANLVSNAIDAMPEGGTLRLGARETNNVIEVSVADTGLGIAEESRNKILDPFYTTKGLRGTGLGLSISSEIILRHGGSFTFETSTQRGSSGTCFLFTLPLQNG